MLDAIKVALETESMRIGRFRDRTGARTEWTRCAGREERVELSLAELPRSWRPAHEGAVVGMLDRKSSDISHASRVPTG